MSGVRTMNQRNNSNSEIFQKINNPLQGKWVLLEIATSISHKVVNNVPIIMKLAKMYNRLYSRMFLHGKS